MNSFFQLSISQDLAFLLLFQVHCLLFLLLLLLLLTNIIKVSLSSLKITSRTLFKVKIENKIRCAQFGKIKRMMWQKDALSDDA